MIKKIIIINFFTLLLNNFALSNETSCDNFKKLSVDYVKCKASLVKDKTISVGKNFVEETKDYQKKEWSDEKKKVDKIKKKVIGE